MSDSSDEELAERVAALEETLDELQGELEPPRGPFGLPRPPSPREVIRFTDEYAIPTAIAILEANVRTLQLLRAVLRGARGAPSEEEVRGRASSLGRTTVERVDGALADLQTAIEDADLPQNDEARSLLEEAQGLNREIRDRLAEAGDADDSPLPDSDDVETGDGVKSFESIDEDVEANDDEDEPSVEIDVDAELASIKDELDEGRTDENGDEEESAADDEDTDGEGA